MELVGCGRVRSRVPIVIAVLLSLVGCSRERYRLAVDRDVYHTIALSSDDPRWAQDCFAVEPDPRSRYYVPENVDAPPMPVDDPSSHQFMKCVWGMKGYQHWLDQGVTDKFENPNWRSYLAEYVPLTGDGKIVLDIDSAMTLAYIHSPDYQGQVEELYLTAIDVSTERFAFETQFFGGVDTNFSHLGSDRIGGEANILGVDSSLGFTRRFATAGTLLVGLANQLTWQFAGANTHSNLSILNFALVQPLLRNGGRAVGLERLTRTQRSMLANLRNFQLYRQSFYAGIVVGAFDFSGRVNRPGGGFGGTGLTSFTGSGAGGQGGIASSSGFGFFGAGQSGAAGAAGAGLAGGGAGTLGGLIGLLQRGQQIRNDEYSLSLQQRTLTLLEANLQAGLIDLTQVDNFRQSIQTLRATLAQSRTSFQDGLDNFKRNALGLPPTVEVELDDAFVKQFELIDRRVVILQDELAEFQQQLGTLPDTPDADLFSNLVEEARGLVAAAEDLNESAAADLAQLDHFAVSRAKSMDRRDQLRFQTDIGTLKEEFSKFPGQLKELSDALAEFNSSTTDDVSASSVDDIVGWNRRLGNLVQSISLAQARARLESVVLEPLELEEDVAVAVARNYRFDYMNNRAALVDSWRLIEFNANALRSVLDVKLSGDIQTAGDNPVKFQAPNGSLNASLAWDAPLTRVQERNNYRQQLIQYARDRRNFVGFDDDQVSAIRSRLRWLKQLQGNLEIQREAVVIAIRRVEFTQSQLSAPLPVPVPGAPPPTFGPTAVQNLLQALADLSGAQNNFMSVWLQYYSTRLQLMKSLGLMELDERGLWIDRPLSELLSELEPTADEEFAQIPPDVPTEYWNLSDESPSAAAH